MTLPAGGARLRFVALSRERSERALLVCELDQLTGGLARVESCTFGNDAGWTVNLTGNRRDPLVTIGARITEPNALLRLAVELVDRAWYSGS